jgi:hypothetical protein
MLKVERFRDHREPPELSTWATRFLGFVICLSAHQTERPFTRTNGNVRARDRNVCLTSIRDVAQTSQMRK